MRFVEAALRNYRNIEFARLSLDAPRVFFVGRNAQGKTNMLEALASVSTLRPFRARDNRAIIGPCGLDCEARFRLSDPRAEEAEARIRFKPRGKEAFIDGKRVARASDFAGRFPVALLSSEDSQLARGTPAIRRRFLDTFLASADPDYFRALQRYGQALRERNALLKSHGNSAMLAAFQSQMRDPAAALVAKRAAAVAALEPLAAELHARLSDKAERLSLGYRPSAPADSPAAFDEVLAASLERDRLLKTTTKGPHRDDLALRVDGQPAATRASEGQQRCAALALSLAVVEYWKTLHGISPVLVVDDVLVELDRGRRRRFWEIVDPELQVLASGTELPREESPADWLVYRTEGGRFERS